jgi:nicotinamidase-related amidase
MGATFYRLKTEKPISTRTVVSDVNNMQLTMRGNDMMDCLIVVDLQNDYFAGGKMELVGTEKAAQNARLLLDRCRQSEPTVIHVQHLSMGPGATFFLPETSGAEIHAAVAPKKDEIVVAKHFPNSFRETNLLKVLADREIRDIVICGAMSHMCIDATVRAAFDLGFNCIVAEDACATKHLTFNARTVDASDVHASFMAALSGTYAEVAPTQKIVADMA